MMLLEQTEQQQKLNFVSQDFLVKYIYLIFYQFQFLYTNYSYFMF